MNGTENVKVTDSFLYFGYGCALNQALLEFRVNCPVKFICKGELKHYKLQFNRKNPCGSARANLVHADNEFTLGVLYEIDKKKFDQLSNTEPAYLLTSFDILTPDGIKSAYAFICQKCEEDIKPDQKHVVAIADYARIQGFPEDYIKKVLSASAKA